MKKLEDNVNIIKNLIGDGIPFFIAGGSVFSILNNRPYNDIDVYFYNEDDYRKIENDFRNLDKIAYKTKNCFSPIHKERIEFISKNFGTPQEIFKTFDFNCSCVAIDSNYKQHRGDNLSNVIEFNQNNIRATVFSRYIKYIEDKSAIDKDYKCIKNIIDYIIRNYNEDCDDYYSDKNNTKYFDILNSCSWVVNNNLYHIDKTINKYIQDDHEKINLFKSLLRVVQKNINFDAVSIQMSTAIAQRYHIYKHKTIMPIILKEFPREKYIESMEKFPEFFI